MLDRPKSFNDFQGQEESIELLKRYVRSSKNTKKALVHTLILGGSGLGKTTLSEIIANELGFDYHYIFCPSIHDISQLVEKLEQIQENDVVFFDEVHRLGKRLQEAMYTVLEDNKLFYVEGTGKNSEQFELELPEFTCVAGTTHEYKLHGAMLRRFPLQIRLNSYTEDQLSDMAINTYKRMYNMDLDSVVAGKIGIFSHGSASRCINFINKFYTFRTGAESDETDIETFKEVVRLEKLDYKFGLDHSARKVIAQLALSKNLISAEQLAKSLNMELLSYKDIVEPLLLKNYELNNVSGPLIEIQPKGRKITVTGIYYFKYLQLFKERFPKWFASESYI